MYESRSPKMFLLCSGIYMQLIFWKSYPSIIRNIRCLPFKCIWTKIKTIDIKCTRCNWSLAFAGESKPSLVLQSWVPKSKSDTDSGVQFLYLWGRSSKHKFTVLSYLIFLSSILFLRCLCLLRHGVQSLHHFHIPHKISKVVTLILYILPIIQIQEQFMWELQGSSIL